jgi:hypothetical protein
MGGSSTSAGMFVCVFFINLLLYVCCVSIYRHVTNCMHVFVLCFNLSACQEEEQR